MEGCWWGGVSAPRDGVGGCRCCRVYLHTGMRIGGVGDRVSAPRDGCWGWRSVGEEGVFAQKNGVGGVLMRGCMCTHRWGVWV